MVLEGIPEYWVLSSRGNIPGEFDTRVFSLCVQWVLCSFAENTIDWAASGGIYCFLGVGCLIV